jgi:hypothetical protein
VDALLFSEWDMKSKLAACHPGVMRMKEDYESKGEIPCVIE